MNMMKEFQNLEGLQNIPGIKRKYKKGWLNKYIKIYYKKIDIL
jgi:hypothetical protein